jgi:hypothetical protein
MQHPEGMKKSRLAIALCPTLSISSSANWLAPSSDLYVNGFGHRSTVDSANGLGL